MGPAGSAEAPYFLSNYVTRVKEHDGVYGEIRVNVFALKAFASSGCNLIYGKKQ